MRVYRTLTHRQCPRCGVWFNGRTKFCGRACRYSVLPVAERFWSKVNKTEECWLWTASVNPAGYGQINLGRNMMRQVHRVAWELSNGPIPEGMFVCHRCDVPRCVRPEHLFLGTQADNMRDASQKGRMHPGELTIGARLTAGQAVEIRRRYAAGGVFQRELGREYGVSRNTIAALTQGRTWRNA